MTDKTPEEQAEHIITLLKWNPSQEPLTMREKEIAYSVYLAGHAEGYHSRDAEIVELNKRLAKAEDPYAD